MSTSTESKIVLRRRANIATRLTETAKTMPDATAIIRPVGKLRGHYRYETMTFRELDEDSSRIAVGLIGYGLRPGTRMALLVKPGIDFIVLTFALFKAGAVIVLIDPGMGKKNLISCLEAVQPGGFVGGAFVQMARCLHRRKFPEATLNVTLGRRWFWGGPTVAELRDTTAGNFRCVPTLAEDPAAVIFTTGSTGPPKGVQYQHKNFESQVEQIRDRYDIQPGGVDLAAFPLFGLFNAAMGTTTVVPDMDASRPAQVDPEAIIKAIRDWQVSQSFASPAVWNVIGKHCEANNIKLPTLKRVLSAGAPVAPDVLARMKNTIAEDGEIYTPYGATEALPVASISASEVLEETAPKTADGAGTCVGTRFAGIKWRVIQAVDGPIEDMTEAVKLPNYEIGELVVAGTVVTREYVTRTDHNPLSKIHHKGRIWHRMGDVGYLDDDDRFWFCGRKAHAVHTADGPMYTVPCESILNGLPEIYRSALVGIGRPGEQVPVMICEPHQPHWPDSSEARQRLMDKIYQSCRTHPLTEVIQREFIFLHASLPVDIRHNSKIFREELSLWAAEQCANRGNR